MPYDTGQTSLMRSVKSLPCWADGSLNGGLWCRSRRRISTVRSTFLCCRKSKKPSTGVPIIPHTKVGIIFRPKNHLVHGMHPRSKQHRLVSSLDVKSPAAGDDHCSMTKTSKKLKAFQSCCSGILRGGRVPPVLWEGDHDDPSAALSILSRDRYRAAWSVAG